jgi:hypothetical protein
VSRSSKGDRGGGSQWLNDGKHDSAVVAKGVEEEKGVAPQGGGGTVLLL